jgi:hypothetical protein
VVNLKGWMMILQLHQQGLSVSAIAERAGHDRKTIRKVIERGLIVPRLLSLCTSRPTYAVVLDLLMARLLVNSQRPGRPSARCVGVARHASRVQSTLSQAAGHPSSRSHLV